MNEQQIATAAAQAAINGIINGLAQRVVQLEVELALARAKLGQSDQKSTGDGA